MISISVIIPVHNAEKFLNSCLEHLHAGFGRASECIVVDDGSTDGSAEVAKRFGATVLSTGGRKGPAHARNIGAKAATGDVLFFIDSDVCVYPNTLGRIESAFEGDPQLDGLIGSYDDSPESRDFVSMYRNLMHCFVHQTGQEQAKTFWSGCGAIRRGVFLAHNGFDESYGRPAIEDIELGYRLVRTGCKLMLDKSLLVKHLKRWTLWSVLKTDVLDRGIPWTELILRDGSVPNDLNLQVSQRVSVALSFLLLGLAMLVAIYFRGYFVTPVFALLFFLMARHWVDATGKRPRSVLLVTTAAFGLLIALCYRYHMLAIVPPVVLGYLLLFLRHRYSYPYEKRHRQTGVLLSVYIGFAALFIVTYLPSTILVLALLIGLAALVAINNQFYFFLASCNGRLFAFSAIPLHLLYHFYNGISFLVGCIRYAWRTLLDRQRKPASDSRDRRVKAL